MKRQQRTRFDSQGFLKLLGSGKTILRCPKKQILISQGDTADAVFYIQTGKVKLSVVSQQGKEAVIALLEEGSFFGEGCLAGQLVCMATATAAEDSTLVRIEKAAMIRALHDGLGIPAKALLTTAEPDRGAGRARQSAIDPHAPQADGAHRQ